MTDLATSPGARVCVTTAAANARCGPHDRRCELREQLGLDSAELAAWDAISRKMRLLFLDGGVLAQFEGYERLREFDWDGYRARYGDIHRLDLILEAEGDSPNHYKAPSRPTS